MTVTSPSVSFGLYALTIKPDGTPSSTSDLQTFSDLDDLRTNNISGHPYASYEPDFWLLNGGYKFLPDDPDLAHVGMMSLDQSDAAGEFADPPVLTVTFSEEHDTDGLVLHFSRYSGDYADSIRVSWYTGADVLIRQDDYEPDDPDYEIAVSVSGFGKIVIVFYSTSRAYRYLRLTGIDYGHLITFSGADIKAASVVEECDPISAELRSNSFDVQIFTDDTDFNPLNPGGYYTALTERQPLVVYETVDSAQSFIGQFFLTDWRNTSNVAIEFQCVDLIGLMEQIPTRGGLYESPGTNVEDLIDDLLTDAAIPYELDPALNGIKVIGWLPAGTLREALQHIAFAVGARVDCSRAWAVKIVKTPLAVTDTATGAISQSQQGIEQSLTLLPPVASVEVIAHNYSEVTDALTLFDGSLVAGTHEIIFDEPAHDLNISGATITASGANYAVISVASAGTVTLTGQRYQDSRTVYTVTNLTVTGDIKPGLQIDEATLVHNGNVEAVAGRVYAYHTQRYKQQVKLFAPTIETGQVVTVDTLYSQQIRGVVESMMIDLAGGMVAHATIIGVAVV